MGLRDIGQMLPPGFRFYPSDEELVCHYLYKKIANEQVVLGTLVEIDLHTCEPWQLPDVAKLNSTEWYFFSFRDRKYATGYRTNRATISGYWKATGKDKAVVDPSSRAAVGMRKTLVFYTNRAPNGIKTGWIMHEFRLENPHLPPKEEWVLCRVFHKCRGENDNKFRPQNWHHNNLPRVLQNDYACLSNITTLPCHSRLHDNQGSSQNASTLPALSPRLGHMEGCLELCTNDLPLHDQNSDEKLVEISKLDMDYDYGFLIDMMSFEYSSINGEAEDDLNFDMRFAAGGNNNSKVVV